MRIAGFVLIAIGIIASVVAFTFVSNYVPQRGFARNLSIAQIQLKREVEDILACPRPERTGTSFFGNEYSAVPSGCPITPEAFEAARIGFFAPRYTSRAQQVFFSIPLGVALAVVLAVVLAGVGMIAFGGKRA